MFFFILNAFLVGVFIDYSFGYKLDYWIHDAAVVYQKRTEWKYSAVVALDDGVPFSVGRKQALPLFSLATDRLAAAGVKGVFFDARVSIEQEGRMPYARCIEIDGSVRWSEPKCSISFNNQCHIYNSTLGNAPLQLGQKAMKIFHIAPYLDGDSGLPEMLLYGLDAIDAIPKKGVVASDRLVTFDSPIARWVDLNTDHATYALVKANQPKAIEQLYKSKGTDALCAGSSCRRIRQSLPLYKIEMEGRRLMLPVSLLASCDEKVAQKTADLLKGRVVVMQVAAPNESTDLIVTAMTTAAYGPKLMTPGAQYLVDAVETIINADEPIPPQIMIKITLFSFIAVLSVATSAIFRQVFLTALLSVVIFFLVSLCFLNPVIQLWPVTAAVTIFVVGVSQMVFFRLVLGIKEAFLMKRYISKPIHELLMSLKINETFKSKHCHVVVLMSDLAGYTTVTGLLKDPQLVLELMNDYLEETSLVLQKKHEGILESYLGDMVCYYWVEKSNKDRVVMYKKALLGAIELRQLQNNFFETLQERYRGVIDKEQLQQINNIIDAGIGIAVGDVVMGELGPKQGIKKFGILGGPLNITARVESLTRLFNADIIIVGDFLGAIEQSGLVTRHLGKIQVKGRILPEDLFALGVVGDPRFKQESIDAWEMWVGEMALNGRSKLMCPNCYQKDKDTIINWVACGLLRANGVWALDQK